MWHICGVLVYRSLEVGSWRCRSGYRSRTLHADELIQSSVRRFAVIEDLEVPWLLLLTITIGAVGHRLGVWGSVRNTSRRSHCRRLARCCIGQHLESRYEKCTGKPDGLV